MAKPSGLTFTSDEIEGLLRITGRVNAGMSVEAILDAAFEELRALLPYDRMEYTFVEEGGAKLRTAWVRTTYQPVLLSVGHIAEPMTPIQIHSEADSDPFLENDVSDYAARRPPDHPASLLVEEGIHAVLSCPMVVAGETIGMLFFASRLEKYDDRHVRLIRHVASQIAGAIGQSRLRASLLDRNAELEMLHQQRSSLLASISHELRNPLTSVVGLSATLRDSFGKLDREEARVLIGILARESVEVAGIVDDILTIARQDTGHLDVTVEPCDLRDAVDQVVSVWIDDEHPITVQGDQVWVTADPLRVRQIIRNLVSNAFKYGSGNVWIEIDRAVDVGVIDVIDDGPGVAPADLDLIFEMYGTGSESNGRGEAIGVGLAVSKQLAEAMSGDLSYSRLGDRSRFRLLLPAIPT